MAGKWQPSVTGGVDSGVALRGNKFQSGNPALDADQRVELTFNERPQRLWFRGDFDPTQATNVTGGDLEALIPADRSQRVVRPFGPDCDGSYQTNRLAVHFADNTCYNAGSGDFFNPGRRANLIGPGAWNTDISIFKNFKFKEIANVRFTADFFNAFNHPNDIDPDAATGLQDLSRQANEPRIIQFSLRVDW